jgi:hypothetical protein
LVKNGIWPKILLVKESYFVKPIFGEKCHFCWKKMKKWEKSFFQKFQNQKKQLCPK